MKIPKHLENTPPKNLKNTQKVLKKTSKHPKSPKNTSKHPKSILKNTSKQPKTCFFSQCFLDRSWCRLFRSVRGKLFGQLPILEPIIQEESQSKRGFRWLILFFIVVFFPCFSCFFNCYLLCCLLFEKKRCIFG